MTGGGAVISPVVDLGEPVVLFEDRRDAGRQLARLLTRFRGQDVVVLGLPRGGVPVAFEVARELDAELDVIVVRKLGVPFQPELGMGAIGEEGVRVINRDVVAAARVTEAQIADVEERERVELERRARRFRGDRPKLDLTGRIAVIVDDGIATGSTARVACQVARAHGAARVVLAVPVAPADWTERMGADADDLVALHTPHTFWAIGRFYRDFSQTSDDEVADSLARAHARAAPDPPSATTDDLPSRDDEVGVRAGHAMLSGHLSIPEHATGIVVFAHGSGSSRHSPRNRYVAAVLNRAGLGTLLFDLLTADEEHDRSHVFDVEMLARRLVEVTRWLHGQPGIGHLPVGYFGASTGAAAALWAAAEPDSRIAAVVSRGGRPDLAAPRLELVAAPTLLIVGGDDHAVLQLNRNAGAQMRCEHRLAVVEGATHLFSEPGALEAAADLASDWFVEHLTPNPRGHSM
jgi:putative phosphoribosyl transferase